MITHQQHWANASKNRVIDESLPERERDREFAKHITRTGDYFNNNAIILEPNERVVDIEKVKRLVAWVIPADDKHSQEKYKELREELGIE